MVLQRTKLEDRQARLEEFRALMKQRIVVLDCAMGTMIQSYDLSEDDFGGNVSRTIPRSSRVTTTCSLSPNHR